MFHMVLEVCGDGEGMRSDRAGECEGSSAANGRAGESTTAGDPWLTTSKGGNVYRASSWNLGNLRDMGPVLSARGQRCLGSRVPGRPQRIARNCHSPFQINSGLAGRYPDRGVFEMVPGSSTRETATGCGTAAAPSWAVRSAVVALMACSCPASRKAAISSRSAASS